MNILYIEDDLVDQMMFKRLCRELDQSINCCIVESVKDLKQIIQEKGKKFDLIFSDIFLSDGNINDVLLLLDSEKVVILSGETSADFLETYVKFPYFEVYNKPLTKQNFLPLLKTPNSINPKASPKASHNTEEFQAIKLANLQRLSKGNSEDMLELMDLALDLIPQRLEELSKGFEEKDWGKVHFSAHAAKGVSRLVGIPVYDELGELDRKARKESPDPEELFTIYQDLLPVLKKAFDELTLLKERVLNE